MIPGSRPRAQTPPWPSGDARPNGPPVAMASHRHHESFALDLQESIKSEARRGPARHASGQTRRECHHGEDTPSYGTKRPDPTSRSGAEVRRAAAPGRPWCRLLWPYPREPPSANEGDSSPGKRSAAARVQADVRNLDGLVVDALNRAGLAAV